MYTTYRDDLIYGYGFHAMEWRDVFAERIRIHVQGVKGKTADRPSTEVLVVDGELVASSVMLLVVPVICISRCSTRDDGPTYFGLMNSMV